MAQINDIIVDGDSKFKVVRIATMDEVDNIADQSSDIIMDADVADQNTLGKTKLYNSTGSNIDGVITQDVLTQAINSINVELEGISLKIEHNDATITTVRDKISTLSQQIDNITEIINSYYENVNNALNTINTLENNINSAITQSQNAKNLVESKNNDIINLKNKSIALLYDLDNIKAKLDNITTLTNESIELAESGSGNGGCVIDIGDVKNITITPNNQSVSLTWQDPKDMIYNNATLSRWLGTKIVRKINGIPLDENDGELILDTKERDKYIENPFIDNNLTNNVMYYYRFFPYTEMSVTTGSYISAIPKDKTHPSMSVENTIYVVQTGKTLTIPVQTDSDGEIQVVCNNDFVNTFVDGNNIVIEGITGGIEELKITQSETSTYFAPQDVVIQIHCDEVLTLNNLSWKQISEIAQSGQASLMFDIGDCKEITLNGKIGDDFTAYNLKLYVFILDFNHSECGTENNNIIFGGFRDALTDGTTVALCNSTKYNSNLTDGSKVFNMNHWGNTGWGGYKGSDMRFDILGATNTQSNQYGVSHGHTLGVDATQDTIDNPKENTLLAVINSDFRKVLKLRKFNSTDASNSTYLNDNITIIDGGVSLATASEIHGTAFAQDNNPRFLYYANGNNPVVYNVNDKTQPVYWYTSTLVSGNNSVTWYTLHDNNVSDTNNSQQALGLCPIFKV